MADEQKHLYKHTAIFSVFFDAMKLRRKAKRKAVRTTGSSSCGCRSGETDEEHSLFHLRGYF